MTKKKGSPQFFNPQPFPWPHGVEAAMWLGKQRRPPPEQSYPWPRGEGNEPNYGGLDPHVGEQWIRYDSVTIEIDDLPALLNKHNRALEPLLALNARCDEVSPPPEDREDWTHDFVPDLGDGWMRCPLPAPQAVPPPDYEELHTQRKEGWLHCDSMAAKLAEHKVALEAHASRLGLPDLLDAIPPGGRSASGRSAPAREPSDTPWEYLPVFEGRPHPDWLDGQSFAAKYPMPDPPTVQDVYGSSGGSPETNTQNLLEDAGEHDIVIVIKGHEYTKREFLIEAASARRRLRQRPPKCAHKTISPRDGLCLECGEIVRDS